jgi:hypothetical protein
MPKVQKNKDLSTKRSEVVTVRLDPRLKYLGEIAARKQRRTLSGYIEWAVEQSLKSVVLAENEGDGSPVTVENAERINGLWEVDEAERIAKLALHYPELLTFEEQVIWRRVRDCGLLWRGKYTGPEGEWVWSVTPASLLWDRLRECWTVIKGVANGSLPAEKLPTWQKTKPQKDSDLDIPF